jgi:putative ABC transport system ATP-binding protein
MGKALVKLERVSRVFEPEGATALNNVNLVVEEGECLALIGPSGSGKTTLLNIMAGVDRPTSGSIWVNGVAINEMKDRARTAWRHQHVGFIFRTFNLVPVLTVRDNVALPLLLTSLSRQRKRARIDTVLELAGLSQHKDSYPRQLSYEQQQRVAIARAIVLEPPLILADEPTGELNAQATEDILILLSQLRSEWGKTVILATHDEAVAKYAQSTRQVNKGIFIEAEALRGRAHGLSEIR